MGWRKFIPVTIELSGDPLIHGQSRNIRAEDFEGPSDSPHPAKTAHATRVLTLSNATKWQFDFSDELLLPWIDSVMYTFTSADDFVQHMARPANGTKVVIEAAAPRDATVTVEV